MPIADLKRQIDRLPEQPGVYLYANRQGDTLYVGKARALRDRVRSYISAYGASPRMDALFDEIASLEVIVTDSVVEALALENHLIKQRSPKYNVLLRDDKNYSYLQLTTNESCPRVLVARRVERDGAFYAGPFLPTRLARKTMSLTHRLFGIRSCNEVITGRRGRPCLEYDIKRCLAPCVSEVCSTERYARAVEDTRLFLGGRNDELVGQLGVRMREAADAERFEEAAEWRDATRTIETLRDRQQKMSTTQLGDRDAFGVRVGPAGAVIQVFQMRRGRVIERIELVADTVTPEGTDAADVLQAGLQQFYEERPAPPEIHVPVALAESDALEGWLSARGDGRVRVMTPKRGDKRGLLDLATRNAALAYETRFSDDAAAHRAAVEALRGALHLAAAPRRIECFDVSTIQGSDTVGAMVVSEDGRMAKGEYRKYRVRHDGGTGHPDDLAAMREVVLRRYRRLLEDGGPFPDLVVIDGGAGQLSAAYGAFGELGLGNLVAIGLAKREERVVMREGPEIALPKSSPALLLLQRIRDEAHRFAVTFHREARKKRNLHSELDEVPGVGPRRRRRLLSRFGSLAGVRRATREELTAAVGARLADAVLAHFATPRL
ncbi:MAG: excinuclease ABC subunit UvrC [Vicinamibacterales bacterium]|jgi:excinuclease ABC subunit C|nr:excinuclease ABC subunit C [Acidobacteriota bacterium]MDP6374028.1 excinuclease ABC subunit UvrC [Vicinamibacterales bacterium]MDP6610626.1 excinuclease ABC subunit UvrC [Vicinamibacterales bacterium]HAK56793.1 excinuclease ABC subunit C [Acidobacteriota bacterium]|tara:strand:+ start:1099 stop:2919 length:1821 start_codon:yes stop_codon:yes gene_type:complete